MLFVPMTWFVKLPCDCGPPKKEILCDDAISADSSSFDSISSNILFLIGLFECFFCWLFDMVAVVVMVMSCNYC